MVVLHKESREGRGKQSHGTDSSEAAAPLNRICPWGLLSHRHEEGLPDLYRRDGDVIRYHLCLWRKEGSPSGSEPAGVIGLRPWFFRGPDGLIDSCGAMSIQEACRILP